MMYNVVIPPKVNKMKLLFAAAHGNGCCISGAFIMDSCMFGGIAEKQ